MPAWKLMLAAGLAVLAVSVASYAMMPARDLSALGKCVPLSDC